MKKETFCPSVEPTSHPIPFNRVCFCRSTQHFNLHFTGQLSFFLLFADLEYAVVRKSAKMIGSLFLLNRSCPTMKQRTTGVIFDRKLILYHNGRNPKTPILLLDLEASMIIEGIEANCRFCIIDGSQTKHEFEALDDEERAEWVTELLKQQDDLPDYEESEVQPPINVYPPGT